MTNTPTKKETLEFLEKAWKLIDQPEKWTRRTYLERRLRNGRMYTTRCSLGAICSVYPQGSAGCTRMTSWPPVIELAKNLINLPHSPFRDEKIIHFNDANDYETVKAHWLKTLDRLREEVRGMEIKEIDVITVHEPLESPIPNKEVVPASEPERTPLPTPPEREPVPA